MPDSRISDSFLADLADLKKANLLHAAQEWKIVAVKASTHVVNTARRKVEDMSEYEKLFAEVQAKLPDKIESYKESMIHTFNLESSLTGVAKEYEKRQSGIFIRLDEDASEALIKMREDIGERQRGISAAVEKTNAIRSSLVEDIEIIIKEHGLKGTPENQKALALMIATDDRLVPLFSFQKPIEHFKKLAGLGSNGQPVDVAGAVRHIQHGGYALPVIKQLDEFIKENPDDPYTPERQKTSLILKMAFAKIW